MEFFPNFSPNFCTWQYLIFHFSRLREILRTRKSHQISQVPFRLVAGHRTIAVNCSNAEIENFLSFCRNATRSQQVHPEIHWLRLFRCAMAFHLLLTKLKHHGYIKLTSLSVKVVWMLFFNSGRELKKSVNLEWHEPPLLTQYLDDPDDDGGQARVESDARQVKDLHHVVVQRWRPCKVAWIQRQLLIWNL